MDVAVLEVGMGGRWDATSATDPVAVAITGIGLDHTRILGDTLEAIAGEKAAVIKPGRLVVLGEGTHEASVQRVMDARCRECGVVPLVVSHVTTKVPAHVGDTVEFSCTTRPCDLYVEYGQAGISAAECRVCDYAVRGLSGPRARPRVARRFSYGLPHAGSL